MRGKSLRLSGIIMTMCIAALLLVGAVPSCHAAQAEDEDAYETVQTTSPVPGREKVRDLTVLPAISPDDREAPKLSGSSAMVMDLTTGTVIYEKNADKVREPASLTKILNCLVILENLPLEQEVTIPADIEIEGSTIGLVPGEKLTVEQLLYGMMLESGNDAAQVLAVQAAGSVEKFADMMNTRAAECGAAHTDFKNPNGLNENPEKLNYTTARDLALITREAMQNEMFRTIVGTSKYTIPATELHEARKLYNSNACLWLTSQKTRIDGKEIPFKYEGCTGVKTGMTSSAGYCLVGTAQQENASFLVVTLNAEDSESRFQDGIRLWNYAFSKFDTYTAVQAGQTAGVAKVRHGALRKVPLGPAADVNITIHKGTDGAQAFTTEFLLDREKPLAPIKEGQKMGKLLAFDEKGRLVAAQDIFALQAVEEGTILSYIGIADEDLPLAAAIFGGLLLLVIIILIVSGVRRRKARGQQHEQLRQELDRMRTAGVGMSPAELADLTGDTSVLEEEAGGPSRVSAEELEAWTSLEEGQRFPLQDAAAAADRQPAVDQPLHHAGLTQQEMEELLDGKLDLQTSRSHDRSGSDSHV